jgi:hypothetical protein
VAAVAPPALHSPSQARKRPLIYVYNMDPIFNSRILQYRMGKWVAPTQQQKQQAAP